MVLFETVPCVSRRRPPWLFWSHKEAVRKKGAHPRGTPKNTSMATARVCAKTSMTTARVCAKTSTATASVCAKTYNDTKNTSLTTASACTKTDDDLEDGVVNLFYTYVAIADTAAVQIEQRELCTSLHLKGMHNIVSLVILECLLWKA